jgi:phosphosulfolactate synthase
MNYDLKNLPERTASPGNYGFTMAMDKGLSRSRSRRLCKYCRNHVDIVKLGWGTSFVTPNLKEKLKVFKNAGIPVPTLAEHSLKRLLFVISLMTTEEYSMNTA